MFSVSEKTFLEIIDPDGRFGKSAFTAAKQNITDFSHSIADTVINVAPGGISALSSVMGYGMDLLGMPSGHLHAQATSINEVLSPYARAGSYDPNSLVSNLVTAGSLVAVPSSAGSRVPSIAAKTATKPLLGSPAGQAGVKTLHGGPSSATGPTFVNLASPQRTTHILTGDATGGGHLFPGMAGKSAFPQNWSAERVMHEISDIATDPRSIFTPGRGGRTIATGARDGVDIKVILGSPKEGGNIITGFPTNVPRNP